MNLHFDGRGHRILSFFDMINRYRGDKKSTDVLRRLAPYRYVVVPDVEIIVKKGMLVAVEVKLIYPGETRTVTRHMNNRSLAALRRLYKSGDPAWRIYPLADGLMFSRRGCVIENKGAVDYSAQIERR